MNCLLGEVMLWRAQDIPFFNIEIYSLCFAKLCESVAQAGFAVRPGIQIQDPQLGPLVMSSGAFARAAGRWLCRRS